MAALGCVDRRYNEWSVHGSQLAYSTNLPGLYEFAVILSQKISGDPGAYGLTPEQCAEYASVDADYRAGNVAAVTPDTHTKGKIWGKNDARASLMALAASLAKVYRGHADRDRNSQKIGLGLSVRHAPTPLANPGTPYKFVANLSVSGGINLQWKCDNPAGATMYQIWRRIGTHAGSFYLGT